MGARSTLTEFLTRTLRDCAMAPSTRRAEEMIWEIVVGVRHESARRVACSCTCSYGFAAACLDRCVALSESGDSRIVPLLALACDLMASTEGEAGGPHSALQRT